MSSIIESKLGDSLEVEVEGTTSKDLVNEMHDTTDSVDKQNLVEYTSSQDTEPINYIHSAVLVESHPLSEIKNGARVFEGSLEYAPQEQIDIEMDSGNSTGLENFAGEQKMDAVTDDESGDLPCDIAEVPHVDTHSIHETSSNSESRLELNANDGKFDV